MMHNIRHRHSIYLSIVVVLASLSKVGTLNAGMPLDACALLTASQVSIALGAALGAGTERNVTVSLMTSGSEQERRLNRSKKIRASIALWRLRF
jgi:hypothetical protein